MSESAVVPLPRKTPLGVGHVPIAPCLHSLIISTVGRCLILVKMELNNLLEVTSSVKDVSKTSGKEFMRVLFRPVAFLPTGKSVMIGDKTGTRVYDEGKQPQVGELFAGSLFHSKTTPYKIEDNTAETITCVVMHGENPTEIANKILERHDACILVNGAPSVDIKAVKAAKLAAAKKAIADAKKAAKLVDETADAEKE